MSEKMPDPNDPSAALFQNAGNAGADDYGQESTGPTPLKRLMVILYGRWLWAIGAAVVLAVAGGVGGWFLEEDLYRSEAALQVKLDQPIVLEELPETRRNEPLRQILPVEAKRLRSQRVIEAARGDDAWRRFDRSGAGSELAFKRSLNVDYDRNEPIIEVSFLDPDPDAAEAATRAVIDAYMRIHGENEIQQERQIIRVLEDDIQRLQTQRNRLDSNILEIAQQYGAEDLAPLIQLKLEALQEVERQLSEARLSLAEIDPESDDADPTQIANDLSLDQLASADTQLKAMVERLDDLTAAIDAATSRFGPQHRRVQSLEREIDTLNRRIRSLAEKVRADVAEGRVSPSVEGQTALLTPEQLRKRIAQLEDRREQLNADQLELGRKRLQIEDLRNEREEVQQALDARNERLADLRRERRFHGRIEPMNYGNATSEPINLGKRKKLALAGFVGGGMFGFGVVVFLAALDRRLRSSDDASTSIGDVPMLGILPALPDNLKDPEQAELAGYSVHHVRTILQLGNHREHAPVLAVTGPTPGSGKTSLALALGMSFATSGSRTLLIDSDIAGGGLSYRLDAFIRRRVGQILLRDGVIDRDQLDRGVEYANRQGLKLGEALVTLDIATRDQVDRALHRQPDQLVGLLDALSGEDLEHCIAETDMPGLFVLPIGGAHLQDMGRVSLQSLRKLLAEARGRFDTVLVDCGPIPGSVETSIIAAEADQAIVVVARGDQRPRVERSVQFLHSIRARVAGFVFNRAEAQDLARSAFSSSLSQRRPGQRTVDTASIDEVLRTHADDFDPVARAVVRSSREEEEKPVEAGRA